MNPIYFRAYTGWAAMLLQISDKVRLEVYDAIFYYAETGATPKGISPEASVVFAFIRSDMDEDMDNYLSICAKRRASVLKRWARVKQRAASLPELPLGSKSSKFSKSSKSSKK